MDVDDATEEKEVNDQYFESYKSQMDSIRSKDLYLFCCHGDRNVRLFNSTEQESREAIEESNDARKCQRNSL
jgi:hypothetical protein